jgi:hypothetical protein
MFKIFFLLFSSIFVIFCFHQNAFSQVACQGTLGVPLVNITFGNGQNPGGQLATVVPGATTSYNYVTPTGNPASNIVLDGNYAIINTVPSNPSWLQTGDHTGTTTGTTNGYMAFFNAQPNPGEFYRQTVNGLCAGTTYEFAAWVLNAIRTNSLPNAVSPNLTFTIFNINNLTTPLVTFSTGPIASTNQVNWQRFSTLFQTPIGVNSVVLSLSNAAVGGVGNPGNDLALDDITFRACGPTTNASFSNNGTQNNNTVCSNVNINLFGTVGAGLNNPRYQWQISSDNGINWTSIIGATTANYTQTGLAVGFYQFRLIAAENGNINSNNCRFISNVISLNVTNCCSDTCYWKVTGNNIINGNNIFGTLTNNDVRIRTNSIERGILSSTGNLGWNTMSPTAYLHVNCNGGNPNNGTSSDVRFEGLENGTGSILVIDNLGYVRNSGSSISTSISNNCSQVNRLPKVVNLNGNLTCSQIYDDATSVGINTTGPFTYTWTGGLAGTNLPPASGTVRLDVAGVTRSLAYIATSDERYKEKINNIESPMKIINSLKGKTYLWNQKAKNEIGADDYKHYGFVAQEVKTVLPEAVIIDKKGYYGIYYNAFIPVLVEGQKELYQLYLTEKDKNEILEKKLRDLTNKIDDFINKTQSTKGIESNISSTSTLSQNIPNPFKDGTIIKFNIAKMQKSAFIMISDLSGKEIKKYPINILGGGNITFRNNELSSGIYVYSLIVDEVLIDSKKMVLTK